MGFFGKHKVIRTDLFETMPVGQAVWNQVLPALVSQLVALLYNLADTYFVGKMNAPDQVAAVTIVMPPFLMLTALSNLFGVGAASTIGHALGRKELQRPAWISSAAFWCTLGVSLLCSLLFLLFGDNILKLTGATAETLPIARDYARWTIVWGSTATMLNLMFINLVRAEGRAATASLGTSLGGILNFILDPFFILPQFLNMGAAGAGLATMVSNVVSALFFFGYLWIKRHDTVISLSPRHLRHIGQCLGNMLSIGFPSAMQYGLIVLATSFQAYFISCYSTAAVAALGIAKKLDMLPLYFALGVAQGVLPLLAYNHGSGNKTRRQAVFRYASFISVGFSTLCLIVYEAFAPYLVRLFIQDDATVHIASIFLRCLVLAMPAMSLCNQTITQFQAINRPREALIVSILRKGGLDIPLLFIMDRFFHLYGCICVQPIVDLIALCVVLFLNRRLMHLEHPPIPRH